MNEEKIKEEILSKLNPYGFKNLDDKDNKGNSVLMFCCLYNISKSLGFQKKHWEYLIVNSDLKYKVKNGWDSLAFVLVFNKSANYELEEPIKKMYNILSEEDRQETFKQICINYKEQNLSEKDILYVLYDLEFHVSPITHKWLEEQKYDDILKMIEKRNVLWNLNQELSEENKTKKGLKL